MLYQALRATASVALRWYYSDVTVQGRGRAPHTGPLVIIANHPNALIDPLLVGTALQRRVLLTAKATLFESHALAAVLNTVGVVPLRRAKDEASADATERAVPDRNARAFRLVTKALLDGRAILVFPEGISHDAPSIAPLKSGAARMALQAHAEGAVGLRILPVGLVYERKEEPGSRVLVRIGDPLALDDWLAETGTPDSNTLTAELDARLRAVTLNFATSEQARRAIELARTLVSISASPASIDTPRALDAEADIAARVDAATTALATAPPSVAAAADALAKQLRTIDLELARSGVTLADVRISRRLRPGLWFTIREGVWAVLSAITTILGGWTHWIPLTLARRMALSAIRGDRSRDQPAMRTILFGVVLVLVWYLIVVVIFVLWRGWSWALGAVLLLFAAAHAHRMLEGRLSRATLRARTYLALRADPVLQGRVIAELDALVANAIDLERSLVSPS